MLRFFARLLALTLSAALLGASILVLVHVRPTGLLGWGVLAGLVVGALLAPAFLYRALMRAQTGGGIRNEGEGAGLAMGAGVDAARRRSDGDLDADPFDYE